MGHYKANLRDIEFNLFEALELGPVLDSGSVGELDSTTTRRSWPRLRASPKVRSPNRSSPPTARPRCFCRTSTPSPCRTRSVRRCKRSGMRSGGASVSRPRSAAPRCPGRWCGRFWRWSSAPTRRCFSIMPARGWPTSSSRAATTSSAR